MFAAWSLWWAGLFKKYVSITKPGIIVGNLITVVGGFCLASKSHVDFVQLATTLLGIALVIASGCVFNNVIDQDIDRAMARTQNRVMAQHEISNPIAIAYAVFLGVGGMGLLAIQVNELSAAISALGLFTYVVVYTLWLKRSSARSTEIGSIAGATPIVVGYTAVTNTLDGAAAILFMLLCLWQIPHSYAITIFRYADYESASIPVLPVIKGIRATKVSIFFYSVLFLLCLGLLTVFHYTGYAYLVITISGAAFWVWQTWQGFQTGNDAVWAKKVFLFSVILISIFSAMLAMNSSIESLGCLLFRLCQS